MGRDRNERVAVRSMVTPQVNTSFDWSRKVNPQDIVAGFWNTITRVWSEPTAMLRSSP